MADVETQKPKRLTAWTGNGVAVAYVLLVLLIIAAIAYNPHFASMGNLRAQLQIASFIGIIAIGQTLVILTGQIDLSVPWNLTFSAILMATLYANGHSVAVAMLAAIILGLVLLYARQTRPTD